MKSKHLAVVLGVAVTGLVGSTGISAAEAATVVQTDNFTPAPEPVPYTWNFTFDSFDTSLGTLAGVNVSLTVNVIAEVDIFNSTSSPQSFANATASSSVTLTGSDPTSTLTITATTTPISGIANPGFNTFPGQTGSTSGSISDPNLSIYALGAPVPQSWTASGGNGTFSGTSSNGVFFSGNASAGGSVTLIYTYTPTTTSSSTVPEPTTIFGSIVALGLGVAMRKMRLQQGA